MSLEDGALPQTDAPGADEQQEDETGFDDGFSSPNAPTETPGQELPQTDPPETPPAPTLEERLASAEALIESLRTSTEKGLGTAFGKLGGIERNLQKAAVDIDQSDIDALRGDGFESHAKALEKIRDLQIVRTGGTLTDEDKAALIQSAKTEAKRELQIEAVEDEHPDWREQVVTPEFQAWKAKQPADIQQRLDNDWNARFITRKLTEFKASRQKPAPAPSPDVNASTRKGRLAAAVTPRGTGATPTTTGPDEFDQGFAEG